MPNQLEQGSPVAVTVQEPARAGAMRRGGGMRWDLLGALALTGTGTTDAASHAFSQNFDPEFVGSPFFFAPMLWAVRASIHGHDRHSHHEQFAIPSSRGRGLHDR